MLIDSHCHLDFDSLSQNLDNVLQGAKQNNVLYIQTICTKISQLKKLTQISDINHNVFCSVGNHPLNISDEGIVDSKEIESHTKHKKIIGIGETGLDYFYSTNTKYKQIESFEQHIIAAQNSKLPIIVHTRNAEADTIHLLKKHIKIKEFSGVIHCFTGSEWLAKQALDLNLYVSASGIVTFKNAESIRSIIKNIVPIEKLLIETDAPFLAPEPMRGKKNKPEYLLHTAEFISKLLNISFDEFCKITTNNFLRIFKKVKL